MDPSTQVGPPRERPNRRYVCRNSSSITPYCLLQAALFESQNIFDNLPSLQAPKLAELHGELDNFLSTDPKHVTDALAWWYAHKDEYLRLHRMALDYLSIPGMFLILNTCNFSSPLIFLATSVDVERTFSQGRILLSHVRNRLSVQSTRALLCLGTWSEMGYVKDKDVRATTILPEVSDDESDLAEDWDAI